MSRLKKTFIILMSFIILAALTIGILFLPRPYVFAVKTTGIVNVSVVYDTPEGKVTEIPDAEQRKEFLRDLKKGWYRRRYYDIKCIDFRVITIEYESGKTVGIDGYFIKYYDADGNCTRKVRTFNLTEFFGETVSTC